MATKAGDPSNVSVESSNLNYSTFAFGARLECPLTRDSTRKPKQTRERTVGRSMELLEVHNTALSESVRRLLCIRGIVHTQDELAISSDNILNFEYIAGLLPSKRGFQSDSESVNSVKSSCWRQAHTS